MAAWALHFASSLAVIFLGSMNHDRKFIPINTNKLEGNCLKAYLNVFASSAEEEGAIICCTKGATGGICGSPPSYFIFARSLTKIPEVWLLPLFPLLVRLVVQFSQGGSMSKHTMRRLFLYIGLEQVRAFILYLLFDKIENIMVASAGDQCWYDDFLKSHQGPCQGRVTDYSDHIVLFYAQLLPIALVEVLFSFMAPFWKKGILVPTILSTGLLYLYLIVYLAAYKTVEYYHTLYETGVGYVISLLTQAPLFLLMSTSLMEPIRDYFFGIST